MSLEKLEAYRHDIAECYESLSDIVEDASEAFQDYHLECKLLSTPNLVRKTRAIIDHCLENEERAAEFLRIVQTNNKDLYESMEKHGAKGPPERTKAAHTLTDDVQSALGSRLDQVSKDIADYSFLPKVTEIVSAVKHMFAERVILTEEYEDFYVVFSKADLRLMDIEFTCYVSQWSYQHDREHIILACENEMLDMIRKLLHNPDIPAVTKHSISLILLSHNMHIYGLDDWEAGAVCMRID